MKKQNGVTLASLTIYIIVAGIIVLMLSFLNANFFSKMTDLTNKTNVTNEYSKFCSAFIRDLKNSNSVLEYNQNEIRFSNGATYEIRKSENSSEKYAIYRDSVKICENIKEKYINLNDGEEEYVKSPYFDYDHLNNTVTVALSFSNEKVDSSYEFNVRHLLKVGGGY